MEQIPADADHQPQTWPRELESFDRHRLAHFVVQPSAAILAAKEGRRPARRTRPNRRERAMTFPFRQRRFGLDDAQRAILAWARPMGPGYPETGAGLRHLRRHPRRPSCRRSARRACAGIRRRSAPTARPLPAHRARPDSVAHRGFRPRRRLPARNKDATPHIYANVPRLFARRLHRRQHRIPAGATGASPAGADDVAAAVGSTRARGRLGRGPGTHRAARPFGRWQPCRHLRRIPATGPGARRDGRCPDQCPPGCRYPARQPERCRRGGLPARTRRSNDATRPWRTPRP